LKKLATITPLFFEGYLIICISSDWVKIFNGLPVFDVMIDKYGKLHFVSQRGIKE